MNFSSYLAIVTASLAAGYFVGATLTSRPNYGPKPPIEKKSQVSKNDSDSDSDSDSVNEDGDLSQIKPSLLEECKMVLVVRSDLGMSIGKIAAQCSHATLACYQTLAVSNPPLLRQWQRTGQTKIALRCSNEEELLLLQAQAQSLNLCARSIQDAGRTQIAAGSRTVLGIGPGPARLINQITGKLKLL